LQPKRILLRLYRKRQIQQFPTYASTFSVKNIIDNRKIFAIFAADKRGVYYIDLKLGRIKRFCSNNYAK
jgi:hypothetical protein